MRLFIAILAALAALVALCSSSPAKADVLASNACSAWGTPDSTSIGVIACGGAGGSAPVACPMGSFADDGCLGAPAPLTAQFFMTGAFQPGGHFNQAAGTSTDYMATDCGSSGTSLCRPPWNVAGADYAIGPYSTDAQLADPAAPGALPAGCTYSTATSGTGGGEVICGGSASGANWNGTFAHFNMGPVGGHSCTALQIQPTSGVSSYLIDDIKYFNDDGACRAIQGAGQDWAFATSGTLTGPLVVSNVWMDGNSQVWQETSGSAACVAASLVCNPVAAFNFQSSSTVTVKYSAFNNFAGRTISPPSTSEGTFRMYYSYIEGWCVRAFNGHAEWFIGQGPGLTTPEYTIDHNVMIQRWDQAQFGEAPLHIVTSFPVQLNTFTLTSNVNIASFIGHASRIATLSGCVGATFDGTACSGSGNQFWVTALTGTIGPNQFLGAQGGGVIPIGGVVLLSQSGGPGTGYLSVWNIESTGGPYFPNYKIGPYTFIDVPMTSEPSNVGFVNLSGVSPLGTATIVNNYSDYSTLYGYPSSPNITSIGGSSQNVTGTITGGTTLTLSVSASLSVGAFVQAADVGSCSSGITSCPKIVSGSGTTYTIAPSVANAGPETMAITNENYCTVPITWGGNLDMTGTSVPLSSMNSTPSSSFVTGC